MVRKALNYLTRGGVVTRVDCFGSSDDKPFKNWTRKIMLRFVSWDLLDHLPQMREGEPSRFQVKNIPTIERIAGDPEEVADLIWGDGPQQPDQPFVPPVFLPTPKADVKAQGSVLPKTQPEPPGEKPVSTGPQPFVPPPSSPAEPLTSDDVAEALGETLSVLKQMGDLMIWMKDTLQKQGKKINEMHTILEQLK